VVGPIRVLLVEDNDIYRESLELVLDRHDGIEVVAAVALGGEAADGCAESGAEVVVIDYRLPDVDGSVAAEEVRERCPEAAIVFLSASAGEEERDAARSAGVVLVRKDEGIDILVDAVRAAASGRRAR